MKIKYVKILVILLFIIAIVSTIILLYKNDSPIMCITLKKNPFDYTYQYTCTGNSIAYINDSKMNKVFENLQSETKDIYKNLIYNQLDNLSVDFKIETQSKLTLQKSFAEFYRNNTTEYKNYFYKEDDVLYSYIDNIWKECNNTSFEYFLSSLDYTDFEKIKKDIYLKDQDNDSSTFILKITSENYKGIFKSIDRLNKDFLVNNEDIDKFINDLDMNIELKTSKKVNIFTPYIKITNLKIYLNIPFSKINLITNSSKNIDFGKYTNSILEAIILKYTINIDYFYNDISIQK